MAKAKAYKTKPRNPLIKHPNEYPIRPRALGKSKGSTQGVAGWRHGYYRQDEHTRDSGDFLSRYLDSLSNGTE